MVDIRQSKNYADYMNSLGWIVERKDNINYFIKKLPLVGSVIKIQRPKKIDFKEIERLSKKHRPFQITIEPDLSSGTSAHNKLYINGFKLSKKPYLPTKTLHLGLTKPIETITANFDKETRRAIRKGSSIQIREYSSPDEIKIFHEFWKKSVKFGRYVPSLNDLLSLKKSFPQSHSIFLASHNIVSSIIGGAIFTRSSHDFGYYWQGFTNNEGRSSLSQYSLLYQGILWAKRNSCKVFDFEGIYDERFPNQSWQGFTHFKKSFNGNEAAYLGAYTKGVFFENLLGQF